MLGKCFLKWRAQIRCVSKRVGNHHQTASILEKAVLGWPPKGPTDLGRDEEGVKVEEFSTSLPEGAA